MAGFLLLAGAGDAAESKPSWQDEWEKTLQAAKKEGRSPFTSAAMTRSCRIFEKTIRISKWWLLPVEAILEVCLAMLEPAEKARGAIVVAPGFKSRMSMRLDFLRTMNLERQAERNANTRTK